MRKSLYGLRPSSCARFGFSNVVQEFGLKKSKCDHLVFYIQSAIRIILLVVYVNDIVIIGDDCTGISSFKKFLYAKFHTKDLGQLKCFLGIDV